MADSPDSPQISIAIPMHGDRSHNVLEVISGLLHDPGSDFEVLVVDNCSPRDPSPVFATINDQRFRLIRNATDIGMVPNWNRCVDLSRGRWICIVHSDDQLLPHALEKIRAAIQRAPGAGLVCFPGVDDFGGGRVVDRNVTHPTEPRDLDAGAEAGIFLLTHSLYCSGMVVRRSAYQKVGGFDESFPYSADEELWPRIAASFPVHYDPARVCVYRRGENNSMMGSWKRQDFAESYRRTIQRSTEHFRNADRDALHRLQALAHKRLVRNWLTIAFLCLCNGERLLARHYLDEYSKDGDARYADIRVGILRLLVALPSSVSKAVCATAMRVLTSRLTTIGTRLAPR